MELIVGKIEGTTTTDSFTMVIINPCIGKGDYVEVDYEGKKYLSIIKEVRRLGDKLLADCIIIGALPRIPFNVGLEVKLASEEAIRKGLGLTTTEADGIYIGKLKDLMVWLPVKKLTRIFIVGKPGAGKSYTMGVIAEELIKKGVPLVIIDAHGEYSSLKVPAESPSEEFKVEPKSYSDNIIEFANTTFNPGADIDISALDNMRVEDLVSQMQCTIINLRGLPLMDQYSIVSKLLNRLLEAIMIMQIPPFYLVLDEAHIFAGRGKQKNPLIKECTEIVRRFAQEGRKFGANLIVLTQRPQLLDVTVRSLSATWIIHQLTDPNDVKIAIESGGLSKEWGDKINWLEPGEAIITGDIVERIPLHIKIRRRETRHGAPGFNPLDFISPEEREKMKKKLSSMKSRLTKIQTIQEGAPSLPLPSLYLPISIDEEKILSKLKENKTLDYVELIKCNLKYMPSLFAEASVNAHKRIPTIDIKDRIKRIIPVDASITILDWRYESAYGLIVEDITNLLSVPQREGKHIQPSPLIMESSGVENLKGLLKNFAISKLTQQIYYHKELNEYSKLGESIEEFKNRIKEKLETIKKNKIAEISSSYESKMKELDLSISSMREEQEGLKKLISEIEEELKDLKKEKVRMEKEGKSVLKISEQIRTREMRINRMEKRLMELSDRVSLYKREKDVLEDKLKEEIKEATSKIDAMISAPLQTIVFQPKHDEVNIEAMHIVWVPMFEAIYRVYFNGSKKDLRFEWNGVNGKGNFGSCSECGTSINQLMESLICHKCSEIYCQDHLTLCSSCFRSVCNEHKRICSNCNSIYCIDEKKYLCYDCGKELCSNCLLICNECKEYLCKDHTKKCEVCERIFCIRHYSVHIKNCFSCNKPLCILEQIPCVLCEKIFCKICAVKCLNCNKYACNLHIWYCSSCNRPLCGIEDKYECLICKKSLCETCVETCQLCGVNLCRIHINNCPECNQKVCSNCMMEKRRFGILRRNLCKICALK